MVEPFFIAAGAQVDKYNTYRPPPPPKDNPRVKVDLDLATPYIFIPRHAKSDEHILVDLGTIGLVSKFEEPTIGSPCVRSSPFFTRELLNRPSKSVVETKRSRTSLFFFFSFLYLISFL